MFKLLSILNTNYNTILIVGDFNLHIDNRNDNKATDFINLLDDLGFMQHVHGPTHNYGHSLDLVVSKGLHVQVSSIEDVALSGYFCSEFTVLHSCLRVMLNSFIRQDISH